MNIDEITEQVTKQKLRMLELYQAKEDITNELSSIAQIIHSLEFALATEKKDLIDKDKLST